MSPSTPRAADLASPWAWVAGGACCGLAWSAAMRAYMIELAGDSSHATWAGTFGAVLVPGAITGAALAWAEQRRRVGAPTTWWLALAPLSLAVAPLVLPGALSALARTGEGSGAAAVALMGVLGGYALGDRGRTWVRVTAGVAAGVFAIALGASVPVISGTSVTDPRGAWGAVLAVSLFGSLALACSIPFRTRTASSSTDAVPTSGTDGRRAHGSGTLRLQRWGMRTANRLMVPLYRRSSGGLHASVKGLPVLLLTVPGRRTGTLRTVPIVYLELEGRLLVVGSAGGSRVEPMWFRNLRAAPRVHVQVKGARGDADVTIPDAAERDRLWRLIVDRAAFFTRYQAKAGGRTIPVALLTPVGAGLALPGDDRAFPPIAAD